MTESQKKAKELIDKFKEEIEKEANEYAYAFGNGIYSDGLYKGFVDSFNSKISERIKVEFTLKILEELKQESPFPNYVPHQYIQNKITELKNRIK
jgi:hypothetical protein